MCCILIISINDFCLFCLFVLENEFGEKNSCCLMLYCKPLDYLGWYGLKPDNFRALLTEETLTPRLLDTPLRDCLGVSSYDWMMPPRLDAFISNVVSSRQSRMFVQCTPHRCLRISLAIRSANFLTFGGKDIYASMLPKISSTAC